ncbi:MAG TPA: HlyD family secretion protein [Vicinamibacterales bacterium]|nr:HlyD family secretion protein [Vicinamibacterales bacterium]
MSKRVRIIIAVVVVLLLAVVGWLWATRGRESTDDAQVDAHVTPIAARVGGTVRVVPVVNNQAVDAGTVLVQIDTRDYELALARAQAELANAQAEAQAAQANVPITSTTATSNVANARGSLAGAEAGIADAQQGLEGAKAGLVAAQAHVREQDANATRAARDVERLRPLLDKQEIPQQQFDAAVADADAKKAAADTARAQVSAAEAAIRQAETRLPQAQANREQASAGLRGAQTAPEQVKAIRARAASAAARVQQADAALKQAQLNLEYTTVKAPIKGIVSKSTVEPGQVIQPGQPLMVIVPLENVWITANFKETQLEDMRVGQRVKVDVDAYGGHDFSGKVESIAAATGARFSLLPPDNATGNFVKVVQRVPVKIVLDSGQDPEHLLRPGMSVTPTVYTR